MLIGLTTRVITVKTVTAKVLIRGVINIDWDNIHREMASIR